MELTPRTIVQTIKNLDIGALGGGAERFAIDLGKAESKQGWRVEIFVFFQTGTEAEKQWIKSIRDSGINLRFGTQWKGHNHPVAFLRAIRSFHAYLDKFKPQIIHSHFQLGTIAGLWWKNNSRKVVVVRTAHLASEWEGGPIGWLKSTYANYIYNNKLDAEIGVSETIAVKLKNEAKSRSLTYRGYIPNGINLRIKDSAEIPSKNPEKLILGTVGRLTEQKGYCYLIDAFGIVLKERPELFLYLIGDGNLAQQLKDQCRKLGIEEKVCFTGLVNNVQKYYDEMDLFVSSSLWEGLPTVLMEAMASGVAIVATDIPGNNDLIAEGKSGWVAQPKDAESLAAAILKACDNPGLRRKFSLAGLEIVKKFSMTEIAKQYSEVYQSIVSKRN